MKKIGILGSGKGSNFEALAEAAREGWLPVKIALLLSDVPGAGILDLAAKHKVPADYIPPGPFRTKLSPEAEAEYVKRLKDAGVELVALAGFMRLLSQPFLDEFPNAVVNIHPSLLPAFPGLESWKQALDYGVRFTGCTVHLVTPEMDAGPIIGQALAPVLPNDTPDTLHARIQVQEHKLYVECLKLWAEGRLRIEGRRVVVS
ncbi:MAG: phosphoribosylglycinamide formyltransferase [Verrucomicrobiae bacterium]|nr:phosphoribosylglycinamide formyltransferase [Verrucomicrobiae bacterium]